MLQFADKQARVSSLKEDAALKEAALAKMQASADQFGRCETITRGVAGEIPREWAELVAEADQLECAIKRHEERIAPCLISRPEDPEGECGRATGSELGSAIQRLAGRVRALRRKLEHLTDCCQL